MEQYNFHNFAEEGNRFLEQLAEKLGCSENKNKSIRVLKSVLHALRNRISTDESVHLLAQLPFCLKAVYVEDWNISHKRNRIKYLDEFFNDIREENTKLSADDFESVYEVKEATSIVLHMLGSHVSSGEIENIKAVLPDEIAQFIGKAFTY